MGNTPFFRKAALMTTTSRGANGTATTTGGDLAAHRAFLLLRSAFTVAPILFGLDKFAN